MNRRNLYAFVYFMAVLLSCTSAFSERAKEVLPNGNLKLENGQNISLAGIQVAEDSLPLLSALVAGKELVLEYVKGESDAKTPSAYVFFQTKELSFPFKNSGNPEESRQMLNRVLLDLGAARVAGDPSGKWQKEFVEAESAAQKKGEGIWSYELQP